MVLAHNVRPLRETGMDEAPDQQTAQPHDREDWRARRTMVEHDVLATKALSWTEKGVYIALLSHCYAGKTSCWPSVPTLADHTGLAARVVTRAVGSLERKGWLSRQVGGGMQTTRYLLLGNPGTTPDKSSPPPDNLSPLTPDQEAGGACQSVTTPLTICHHPPDNLSPEAVQDKQYKISSTKESIVVDGGAAGHTPVTTAQNAGQEPQAMALCTELRIPPTASALKAMANVVKDFGAVVGRPLEDVAVDAADWLDRHPKKPRSVAFFRNWARREFGESAPSPPSLPAVDTQGQPPPFAGGHQRDTRGIVRDRRGRAVWLPERSSVIDHTWGAQRDAFIADWGRRPEFMTAEQRAEAHIPDTIPWHPECIDALEALRGH